MQLVLNYCLSLSLSLPLSSSPSLPLSLPLSLPQEFRRLQRANHQLEEEVKRLQQTMAHSMVDRRDMEAALHRAEEEVR